MDESRFPVCPYYKKESPNKLYCEGAAIKPPDSKARSEIVYKYCASMENYKNCPICQMLTNYYERMYEERRLL
jgi:hypothetical protein